MTGWRLGYTVTRNAHVARLLRLGNYTQTAGVTTFLQYAGAEALNNVQAGNEFLASMVEEFTYRRDALYDGLKGVPGVTLARPQGAFYVFPNFSGAIPRNVTGEERKRWVYDKLLAQGICTVYGACFGRHFIDNVRLSFSATPIAAIEEAAGRIHDAFARAAAQGGQM
jgi:aspartate aminotransferase